MRLLLLLILAVPVLGFAQEDTNMRAIQLQRFGDPDVLEVHEIPRPVAGRKELLVRVRSAGVNPVDASIRAFGTWASLPYVPGFDLSGEVVAVGSGVDKFKIGDEIYAMLDLQRAGAYAEYALVKEDEAALKPSKISHSEAASLPLVSLTAWQALIETADLRQGQTVLIHAGAGGVGSIAVQLAKWRGATVITTASDYNHGFLRDLGADTVVDYRRDRFEDFAADVDVVFDLIGGKTQDRSIEVLRDGGRLVSLVGLSSKGQNPGRKIEASAILVKPDSAQLGQIGKLVDEGILQPIVTYRFPLEQAPKAHEQSETRHTRGKIVLEIDQN